MLFVSYTISLAHIGTTSVYETDNVWYIPEAAWPIIYDTIIINSSSVDILMTVFRPFYGPYLKHQFAYYPTILTTL